MGKKIALTFDDGPSTVTTPQVLEKLKKYNIEFKVIIALNVIITLIRVFLKSMLFCGGCLMVWRQNVSIVMCCELRG